MRGLKQYGDVKKLTPLQVASFTDAWIETYPSRISLGRRVSHLLQMRGLKRLPSTIDARTLNVASFTDAWIETSTQKVVGTLYPVASFTDAWIETFCKH